MALIENINVSSPNDGLGDSLRDSQIKANNNFAELNDKKVEKIAGKDLSKNDFTDDLKTKLDSLEFGSGVQIQADWIQTDNLALDYIKNKPELSQYFSAVGGFDYEDLATQTTPLNYTTGFLQLTNDILGANTKTNLNPYGVTSVWNDTTDTFDFNQLSIGDEVFLRVHLNLTTTTANQISGLRLLFAEGTPSQYILPIDLQIYHKTAGLHDLMREISFYIGNEDWRTLPVKLQFNSDANASIKVHGFHPYIIRKSVNILDVNDDNYKTFEIANIEVNLDDTTVADGRISFGYNLATSKINAVLFDAPYSSYIYNYDQLKLIYDFSLNFFDKTNGKSYTSFITGFTQIGARYKLDLNETLNYTDYTILDKIEVFINATKKSTGGGVSAHSQLTLDDGTNPHGTTKNDVGLGNVDNTSDVNKPIATATQIALNLKEDKANKGIANGYVPLNASTLIDSIYLPSYVDDIIEVADFASLPLTGETGKIYITLDDNKQYRWSGSVYVNMTDTTIPSLQEVTDVESITTNPVIVNTIGTTALQVYSDTNNGVIAGSDSGVGLAAYSISYLGALISSTSGTGAIIVSDSGTGLNVITTNGIGQIIDTSQFNINDSLQVNKQNVGTVFKVSHDGNVTANSFIKSGGLSTEFLKADGSVDTASYLTTIPNLQEVTDVDGTTTNQILSNASASVGETAIVGINLNVGGGTGVAGSSQAGIGVYGDSIDSYGVFGDSTNDVGVYGESTNGNGVYGLSYAGTAGRFETINGSKIATFFTNNVEKAFVNSDGDIKVKSILDANNQLGTTGQILSSNGTSIDWIDAPSGTTPSLQEVTDVGNITTKPISVSTTTLTALSGYSADSVGVLARTEYGDALRVQLTGGALGDFISVGNSGDVFKILNTGLTGINTDTPTAYLDINGSTRLRGTLLDTNNQSGTSGQVLSSTGTGVDWIDAPSMVSYIGANADFDFLIETKEVILTILNAQITNTNLKAVSFIPIETTETSLDDFSLNGLRFNIENIIDGVSFDIRAIAEQEANGIYRVKYLITI